MEKFLKKLPFYDHPWFNFLRFLVRHFFEDDCQQKAASLTYTTLLSLVPILTVLLMILSTVPALESVREQISQLIYSNLMPQSTTQVTDYLNDFADKSTNLTAIGAMALFVTTIMTLTTIERAFNKIWRVDDRSGGLKSILRYWTIITLGPLVLGAAFILSGAVQSLSVLNQQVAGYGIDWAFWLQLFSFAVTIAGFVGMYWFIPKATVPIKNAAIAGVIIAILFELLKHTFGTVMANFTSYEAVYGAFAALPIFLLWIYLSWNLILLGVEISYTLTIFATREVYPRHPLLSLLDMLNLVYERHEVGDTVNEQELRNVLGRKELPKWYTYLNYLKDSDLIALTDKDNYVLKRDISQMSLWEFYKTLPYPLPIKDELDEMDIDDQHAWLNALVTRFINTEKHAKSELDIPLSAIFANSEPRQAHETNEPIVNDDIFKGSGRFDGDYEPKVSNSEAAVSTDHDDHQVIIPDSPNDKQHDKRHDEPNNKTSSYPQWGTASTNSRSVAMIKPTRQPPLTQRAQRAIAPPPTKPLAKPTVSKSPSVTTTTAPTTPQPAKKRGLLGLFGKHKNTPLISEDDNPDKRR